MFYGSFDLLSLVIKIISLYLLGAVSQLSFAKKQYSLAVFTLGVWLLLFRFALIRAVALYIGAFGKEAQTARAIQTWLQTGQISCVLDTIVVIGSIFLIADLYKIITTLKRGCLE